MINRVHLVLLCIAGLRGDINEHFNLAPELKSAPGAKILLCGAKQLAPRRLPAEQDRHSPIFGRPIVPGARPSGMFHAKRANISSLCHDRSFCKFAKLTFEDPTQIYGGVNNDLLAHQSDHFHSWSTQQ